MKKNILLILALSLTVFSSCDRKAEFKHESFATFEATTYSVGEDNEALLQIPVTIYNPTSYEVQLRVSTSVDEHVGKAAVEGTNYEWISPSSGVLIFEPGETTKYVEIKILHDTKMTGTRYLDILIEGTDEYFHPGNINKTTCKIRDYEHPLRHFIGDWTGEVIDYMYEAPATITFTIAEDENDETYTKLRIYDFDPAVTTLSKTFALKGVISDMDGAKSVLSIAPGQPIGYEESYGGYVSLTTFAFTSDGYVTYPNGPINFVYSNKNNKESLVLDCQPYGAIVGTSVLSLYEPYGAFTKK